MEKVNTHVLIDRNLRDLAKARNISISKTINDALASRLAVPNTKEELIVQKFKLKEELKAVTAKADELDADDVIRTRREVVESMDADVKELRDLWIRRLNGKMSDENWGFYVGKFCKLWDVERAVAVQYAEGKKDVIKQ